MDTVRADHLGIYGYHRNTSPFLDAYANENILFENAFSNAFYTLPSHFSIFTGVLPTKHLIDEDLDKFELDSSIKTLPQILKERKYATNWYGPTHNIHLNLKRGLGRGIDNIIGQGLYIKDDVDNIIKVIRDQSTKSLFLFIHSYLAHSPYLSPDPFNKSYLKDKSGLPVVKEKDLTILNELHSQSSSSQDPFDLKRIIYNRFFNQSSFELNIDKQISMARYDGAIAYLDSLLNYLFSQLTLLPQYSKTAVIITADHGEAFGEHKSISHQTLYNEVTHVPLIIRIPGYKSNKINALVQSIDIVPTILELINESIPQYIEGKSMLPLIDGSKSPIHDYIFMSSKGWYAIRSIKYKVFRLPDNSYMYFDILKDPNETMEIDTKNDSPEELQTLKKIFEGFVLKNSYHKSSSREKITYSEMKIACHEIADYIAFNGIDLTIKYLKENFGGSSKFSADVSSISILDFSGHLVITTNRQLKLLENTNIIDIKSYDRQYFIKNILSAAHYNPTGRANIRLFMSDLNKPIKRKLYYVKTGGYIVVGGYDESL